MARCIACGNDVLFHDKLGNMIFCKSCSRCIRLSKWKNPTSISDEELHEIKSEVIFDAKNCEFEQAAIEGLISYFEDIEEKGFKGIIKGGCGQTLEIYKDHCIIETNDRFDPEERAKDYAKICRATRPKMSFWEDPKTEKAIVRGILSGNIVKTGINLATSAIVEAAVHEIVPSKEQFNIYSGKKVIWYNDISDVELCDINTDCCTGVIRFSGKFNSNKEILFFFGGNSSYDFEKAKKKLKTLYPLLQDSIYKAKKTTSNSSNIKQDNDNFSEIRKYKQLFDDGIITEEEFERMKRKLLDL